MKVIMMRMKMMMMMILKMLEMRMIHLALTAKANLQREHKKHTTVLGTLIPTSIHRQRRENELRSH